MITDFAGFVSAICFRTLLIDVPPLVYRHRNANG
jgi:hypothetical protein